jgi:hypothetical protein
MSITIKTPNGRTVRLFVPYFLKFFTSCVIAGFALLIITNTILFQKLQKSESLTLYMAGKLVPCQNEDELNVNGTCYPIDRLNFTAGQGWELTK